MTEAPRSLKLPVGENHSSLNRAGTPRQSRETSGVQALSHRDRIGNLDRQRGRVAPQRSLARIDHVAPDSGQGGDHQRRARVGTPARL